MDLVIITAIVVTVCFFLGLFLLPPFISCTPLGLIYLALFVYVYVKALDLARAAQGSRRPKSRPSVQCRSIVHIQHWKEPDKCPKLPASGNIAGGCLPRKAGKKSYQSTDPAMINEDYFKRYN